MDAIVAALAEQQAELSGMLRGLGDDDWRAPTRCEGWDVADVVLHLAQTDELALASATGRLADATAELRRGLGPVASVDDAAARMVEQQRGLSNAELLTRWCSSAARLVQVLDGLELSTRVPWVAGELSARTLAATRLAETWIHTGDVAGALGRTPSPTDRLQPIARLAWRTLPYAFASAGRSIAGPVAFHLVSPSGSAWDFIPEQPALTTISGSAAELCALAARRLDPSATTLHGDGPDAALVLELVRTYAL